MNYQSLDLALKDMVDSRAGDFPKTETDNYHARYESIKSHLKRTIHNSVNQASMMADILSANKEEEAFYCYLTDHGPEHVAMVEQRAAQLIHCLNLDLTPYEVYILLAAVQFHDVGNFQGRVDHESRVLEIMLEMGSVVAIDRDEKLVIARIAAAHGGHVAGDPTNGDTLGKLEPRKEIFNQVVRQQLLAAVLRLADELAEDRSRAVRFTAGANLLQGSEIYHAYSLALSSVNFLTDQRSVKLRFITDSTAMVRSYTKQDKKVFLLDEVLQRAAKCFAELRYCSSYIRSSPRPVIHVEAKGSWSPYSGLDGLEVDMEVYSDPPKMDPMITLGARLREDASHLFRKEFEKRLGKMFRTAVCVWASESGIQDTDVDQCMPKDTVSGEGLATLMRDSVGSNEAGGNPNEVMERK